MIRVRTKLLPAQLRLCEPVEVRVRMYSRALVPVPLRLSFHIFACLSLHPVFPLVLASVLASVLAFVLSLVVLLCSPVPECPLPPPPFALPGKYNDFSTSNASPKMDKETFLSTYNKGRGAYLETTLRSRTASNVFNKAATPAPKAKYFRRTARELEVECHRGFKSTYEDYMTKNLDLLKSKGANRSASNIFNKN